MDRGAWCGLLSMGSQRVGHDCTTSLFTCSGVTNYLLLTLLPPHSVMHRSPWHHHPQCAWLGCPMPSAQALKGHASPVFSHSIQAALCSMPALTSASPNSATLFSVFCLLIALPTLEPRPPSILKLSSKSLDGTSRFYPCSPSTFQTTPSLALFPLPTAHCKLASRLHCPSHSPVLSQIS